MAEQPRPAPDSTRLAGTLHCAPDGSVLGADDAMAALLGWDSPHAMLADVLSVEQLQVHAPEGRRIPGRRRELFQEGDAVWKTRSGEAVRVRTTLRRLPGLPAEGTVLELVAERMPAVEGKGEHPPGEALPLDAVLARALPLMEELLPPDVRLRWPNPMPGVRTPQPGRLVEVLVLLSSSLARRIAHGSEIVIRARLRDPSPNAPCRPSAVVPRDLVVELVYEGTPPSAVAEDALIRSVVARLRRMDARLETVSGYPGPRILRLFCPTAPPGPRGQSSERMR